jgi:hypothetical protein
LTDHEISDFDLYLFGEGNLFDSDDTAFGGSGYNQQLQVQASSSGAFGRPQAIRLNLPPLGAMFFAGP